MTGVDSHNHAEKRAASKIFVSSFHVFIAGIKVPIMAANAPSDQYLCAFI